MKPWKEPPNFYMHDESALSIGVIVCAAPAYLAQNRSVLTKNGDTFSEQRDALQRLWRGPEYMLNERVRTARLGRIE